MIGSLVGSGQCVALVRECAGLPPTSSWRRGAWVRDTKLEPGTCIATFDPDGRYGNHTDGRSHACILVEELHDGLRVVDQWYKQYKPQHVHERVIRFKGGNIPHADDGDAYYTIEVIG